MIDRIYGTYYLVCDVCGEEYVINLYSMTIVSVADKQLIGNDALQIR